MINWASPMYQYLAHRVEIDSAVKSVLYGNKYILGPELEAFEREFGAYIGCRHAIGVSSGYDALMLAMQAMRIGRGDEVITVAMTAPATIQAIQAVGATPVAVDIDPDTRTIDVKAARNAITKRTRAIIPVHLYGMPCDMLRIKGLGLPTIEDCAQATGATFGTMRVGSIGDIGCFSFYPTKNLGALGDGGMITANDPALAARLRVMRLSHRLDELQAAVLRVKLKYLDKDNERRREIAKHYGLMPIRDGHVYHLYAAEVSNREGLLQFLRNEGIIAGVHYAAPALRCNLRHTQKLCETTLSLPMYPELTDAEVDRVLECLQSWSRAAQDSLAQHSAITGQPNIQPTV